MNVITELERVGWSYEFTAGEDEIKCTCPFHEEGKNENTCSVNTEKQIFNCFSCKKSGDIFTLLAGIGQTTRSVVIIDLEKRCILQSQDKTIEARVVEKHHQAIWNAKPILKELYNRGINDESIRKYRLGFDKSRVTIPVKNKDGNFVNIRKHAFGASHKKVLNSRGRGEVRLYPLDQLEHDSIVVCGGELKAILVAQLLNEFSIGAITATAGEGNWNATFNKLLEHKQKVWILLDIDEAGVKASQKIANMICNSVSWVGIVDLSKKLSIDKYPTGDINDWIGKEKATADELITLLNNTDALKFSYDEQDNSEPTLLELNDSYHARYTDRRIQVNAVITGVAESPFALPKTVEIKCTKEEDCCVDCPVFSMQDNPPIAEVHEESQALLSLIGSHKVNHRVILMEALKVPQVCKSSEFIVKGYRNVEDIRVSPQLEIASHCGDRNHQPAICIGENLELNGSYTMTGRMLPHPKTQEATLVISDYQATADLLSSYQVEDFDALNAFQPDNWTDTGLREKLHHIYEDLSANVTRIYKRQYLHCMIDLAYHSALLIPFDGKVNKGWVEVLIVGDSSQGKSETTENLLRHYDLGQLVSCDNATVPGLLGGVQQFGNRWFVSWGVIPTNDRRLVVLEEFKKASPEVIGRLTNMRSSGIAEIPKIEKRRTHARTRLVVLSNTRDDIPIASHSFGIQAVKNLIGGLENIRRFDCALIVAANEIDPTELNELQQSRPKVEHVYTSDLCKKLILWGWTREAAEIKFEDESRILKAATRMSKGFDESIPLVDRGSMRLKIARLATAVAIRTFSCGVDPNEVLVRNCHVDFIEGFLTDIYSSETFGYSDYTASIENTTTVKDSEQVALKILQTPYPKDFIESVINTDRLHLTDISDFTGWNREQTQDFLSFLVRKRCFKRFNRNYRKTPTFIHLLKELLTDSRLKTVEQVAPEFMKDM